MENHNLNEYLKTAFEYKNNGDYKKSIDYFYKALAIDNESSEIMSELAQLYINLNRYDRALGFYEQILLKNPHNNSVKFSLAKMLKSVKEYKRAETVLLDLFKIPYNLNETAEELFDIYSLTNDFEKIISCFKKYSNTLNSSKVLYYTALAYSKTNCGEMAEEFYKKSFTNDEKNILSGIKVAFYLFEEGHLEQAQTLALKLLQYKEHSDIYYLLAEIAYSKSNIDDAVKYYSYAIKSNSQNSLYYFKLAVVFSLKGFFNEAEECFCRAIDLEPDNLIYNYALAYLYYINKNNLLSEKKTDYILSINPEYSQAVCLKVILLLDRNEIPPAAKFVEKLESLQEKDDFIFYTFSLYYSCQNLTENALDYILKAIELNPSSIEYKYRLAKLFFLKKEFNKTSDICKNIIAENPKYIQAYVLCAKTEMINNNFDTAISHINEALNLDKNLSEAYSVLGDIYFLKQSYSEALENFKIAVSINPNEEKYFAKIAECFYKLGNFKDSYFYYKEAADFDITNASYRYYMAKCSEFTGDVENAISNFSVMKRLAPMNIQYITEYADFLFNQNKKKNALSVIKSILKNAPISEKPKLKALLNKFK